MEPGGRATVALGPPPEAALARRRRALARRATRRLIFLGPGLAWWALFLLVPLGLLLAYSFFKRGVYGGVVFDPTLDNYRRAFDPLFFGVFLFSIRVALITTGLALLIGYPAAYLVASLPQRWRVPLLILVVLPFWTNFLIRTYAWIVLLNRQGLINRSLMALGVIDQPLPLLNNEFAIVLGLLYAYVPLMILPIYAAIERLGPTLREAAADLGASPLKAFFTVTLPLTRQGVVAGCIFVFVPSLGNFPVPDLLGGERELMIGNLIQSQFLEARDWPFGATLALLVIALMVALLLVQAWLLNRERVLVDDAR